MARHSTGRIYQFIVNQYAARGSLTFRSIQSALGIPSLGTVAYHLKILENLGLIERDPYVANAIRPTEGDYTHAQRLIMARNIAVAIDRRKPPKKRGFNTGG